MMDDIINKRFEYLKITLLIIFIIVIIKLYSIIIVKHEYYKEVLASLVLIYTEGSSAPRGRIYDRNYNLIVDNKPLYVISYKKEKKITFREEKALAYEVSSYLDLPYEKLSLRNLKEYYLLDQNTEADKKITKEEYEKAENRLLTADDIYNLKIARITETDLSIYNNQDKEAIYLYYLMNKGYSYEEHIIKDENVSDNEYAYIAEHSHLLRGFTTKISWERVYLYGDTLRGLLGSIGSIPSEEVKTYLDKGYQLNDIVGTSYIEKTYEEFLKGKKEIYKIVNNNLNLYQEGRRGNDIVLTIDINLQKEIETILEEEILRAKKEPNTDYYNRSYVIITEPNTGAILAISGKQILSKGGTYKFVDYTTGLLTNPVVPGSIIKAASILVGYDTGVLKIGEVKKDECIKIQATPKKCSWKTLGNVNDLQALAMSSNVYQFKIAMDVAKAKYIYDGPLKINPEAFDIYRNLFNQFGLGVKTGIDFGNESLGYIGNKTDAGFLLDFAMGQYDSYTAIQISQYINTIASNGNRYKPYILKAIHQASNSDEVGPVIKTIERTLLNTVDVDPVYLDRVKLGLRTVMTSGLGRSFMDSSYNPAGKTGTSETFVDTNNDNVIDTETLSNAFVGYAPYDNPRMAMAIISPDIRKMNSRSTYQSTVNKKITKRVSDAFFQIFK